eukprot:UN07831
MLNENGMNTIFIMCLLILFSLRQETCCNPFCVESFLFFVGSHKIVSFVGALR